jgi:hypothetical protein
VVILPWSIAFQLAFKAKFWEAEPSVSVRATMAWVSGSLRSDCSRWCRHYVAPSDEVVGGQCQSEHPIDQGEPAVVRFPQPANGPDPTEDLFDPFALALTERVSGMARGALIDNTGLVASEMRGNPMLAHFPPQCFAVMALVGTQRNPVPASNLLHHRDRRLGFGAAGDGWRTLA